MREDPIVFEDWEPGVASRDFSNNLIRTDLIASLLISVSYCVVGVVLQDGALLFAFLFVGLGLFVVEYFFDQYQRSFQVRLFTLIIFLLIVILLGGSIRSLTTISYTIITTFVAILFVIKLILIPLISTSLEVSGEILVPKTKEVEGRLQQQIQILSATDYAVTMEQLYNSRNGLIKSISYPFLISFSLPILLFGISLFLPDIRDLSYFIVIVFLIFSGLGLLSLIVVWFRERRKTRMQIERKFLENGNILPFDRPQGIISRTRSFFSRSSRSTNHKSKL